MIEPQPFKKICLMFIIDYLMGFAGTENQLLKLIDHLDKSKFDIHLVCLLDVPWLKDLRPTLKCRVTALNYDMFNHKKPMNLISCLNLFRVIRNFRPDIVMTFFPTSHVLGVLAARLAGVQHIFSTRRDFGLWVTNRSLFMIRLANRFVDRIITNAYTVKKLVHRIERFDASKIDVIYNGINVAVQHPDPVSASRLKSKLGIRHGNRVVGIVAGLKPMKRHETFLKAARWILDRRDDVNFVLVGVGPRRHKLEAMAADLAIGSHVHFAGHQENVTPYLEIFDLGVNCSANEGLSNAIMEYMVHGIPCIVSNAGGNPELIENGKNGFTFTLGDHKELAKHILLLLSDPKRQKEFARASKLKINNQMSMEKMIEAYSSLFKKAVVKTAA